MQEREHPDQRTFVWLRRIMIAVVVICFVMDFLPTHGAPDFRYTGSDPAFDVWNFGWPLALAIYDSRFGIHFSPFLYLLVPFQLIAVAVFWATLALLKRHNHPVEENDGEPFRFVSDEKT